MNKTTMAALLSEVTPWIHGAAKRLASTAGGAVGADDLVQVGMMAAYKAAQTYDASEGTGFRTWCWHPVYEEMKRARNASRSLLGRASRLVEHDVSFSAPVAGESKTTVGDVLVDAAVNVEEAVAKAEREAQVREIVARVRAGWKNKAMFDDLVLRLMTSTFGGEERNRSEVPLAEIAAKHGMSRQGAHVNEKLLRTRLERALATMQEA